MNYSALIQHRKSVREFTDKKVSAAVLAEIESYYQKSCQRLIPELETKLCVFGEEAREALEGAAGYESFWSALRIIWFCSLPRETWPVRTQAS